MLMKSASGRLTTVIALALTVWLTAQVGSALAQTTTTETSPVLAQTLPTPTPFRFLTPTPFVPGSTTTTSTTTTGTTPPRAGGFPMELAFPILAGGLAAIAGGSLVLRRKASR
jgi:hypothetical protein